MPVKVSREYILSAGSFLAQVEGLPAKEDERVIQVATGWSYSALVTDRGNVYTWGWGEGGRLGHGDTVNQVIRLG